MLAIVGGLFVLEAVSVIIQVFWFKRTGRRVFRMAPIHHHFEQKGWKESTVGIRSWDDLPANARRYLERIAEIAETPVDIISTGPDRADTIVIRHPFE